MIAAMARGFTSTAYVACSPCPSTARALSETASTVPGMTVTEWLLDSDPAIRWQVMRDLLDEPAEVVATERARVATEGWGARLLE